MRFILHHSGSIPEGNVGKKSVAKGEEEFHLSRGEDK
jgi:hypothetical protein